MQRIWTDGGLRAYWVLSDAEPGLLGGNCGQGVITLW